MSDSRPLRGEAAWRAFLKDVGKRNEQARAEGARRRAAKEAEAARDAATQDRRESRRLPRQPGR